MESFISKVEGSNPHPIPHDLVQHHGPFIVSNKEDGEKIYSFLHQQLPNISKRSLRKYFQLGCVSLNGIPLLPTHVESTGVSTSHHDIESKRVQCGDSIELFEEWKQIILTSNEHETFRILQECSSYAIVEKVVGVEAGEHSMFHYVCRQRLWNSTHYDTVVSLHEIEFGISGIMIYFPSTEMRSQWLSRVRSLQLTFTCLVCGTLSVSHNFESDPTSDSRSRAAATLQWEEYCSLFQTIQDIQINASETVPCRSKESLTLLTMQLSLSLPFSSSTQTSDEQSTEIHGQYSRDLKQIKRLFKRLNHPIVGHDDQLIKNKGLYFVNNQLSFSLSGPSTDEEIYSIEVPNKLKKTLQKEQEMWLQQEKEQESLRKQLTAADSSAVSDQTETVTTSSSPTELDKNLPIEYQLGKASFYGLVFVIAPPPGLVMIPRKSSETLVSTTLRYLSDEVMQHSVSHQPMNKVRVIDMGTGSGCLLLSILHHLIYTASSPCLSSMSISGIGIDLSSEALQIAQQNAQLLHLDQYCHFQTGSFTSVSLWLDVLLGVHAIDHGQDQDKDQGKDQADTLAEGDAVVNVIVCNPPYSAKMENNRLSKRVKTYEPMLALYADKKDALKAYRDIAKVLKELVESDRITLYKSTKMLFVIELGQGQESEVRKIFEAQISQTTAMGARTWEIMETGLDHKGIHRCLVLRLN